MRTIHTRSGLLLRRLRTQPVILLTERSTLYKDLLYGFDLLCHRVIKVNGRYCITPDFFRSAYWGGRAGRHHRVFRDL